MPSPEPPPLGDPAARTRLGRQRSALALGVIAALLLHGGAVVGPAGGLLLGAFALAAYARRVSPLALTAVTVAAAGCALATVALR